MSKVAELRAKIGEVSDIHSATALLHWDQEVYMPPKAGPGRGRQLATLSALSHRLFTHASMGKLLHELQDQPATLDADDAKLVSETLYDFDRATRLPEAFVETLAEEQSKAYEAWVGARKNSDFKAFQPHLERLLELLRQKADYFGYEGTPYNALLEEYERGMTAAQLDTIFGELQIRQSELVERIVNAPRKPDIGWTEGEWDVDAQWALTMRVLQDMGYDLQAGRQDKSVHPFTTNFDLYDVRITTRLNPRELFSALTGSLHEGGHALYEQGFLEKDRRTPLAQGISLGIHESQSRMWENMIGRSLHFWEHYTPLLQETHAGKLDAVSPQQVYQAVNYVAPSLIRVEADECTYNLHIILRYELERALLEGDLAVRDLPEAWNAKIKEYLGLDVPDDARGCLQDIHWSHASIGYFPTYALGNLYAAQFFEKMLGDLPELWSQVRVGEFQPLLAWLRTHIHQVGRRKTAVELIKSVTGEAPSAEPFLRYLNQKYSGLYDLAR